MGWIILAFAWLALVLAIKETEGIWRWFLCIALAVSIISYFIYPNNIIFVITMIISVFCMLYLAYKGYDFFVK